LEQVEYELFLKLIFTDKIEVEVIELNQKLIYL